MDSNDLDKLKDIWLKDPCWDIEDTEGFEKYRTHLRLFRIKHEQIWANQYAEKVKAKADSLNVSINASDRIINYERSLQELNVDQELIAETVFKRVMIELLKRGVI